MSTSSVTFRRHTHSAVVHFFLLPPPPPSPGTYKFFHFLSSSFFSSCAIPAGHTGVARLGGLETARSVFESGIAISDKIEIGALEKGCLDLSDEIGHDPDSKVGLWAQKSISIASGQYRGGGRHFGNGCTLLLKSDN